VEINISFCSFFFCYGKRLINVPRDASSDNSDANDVDEEEEDSSSDDNDSLAAAHAAAIGHSPNPILFQSENPHDTYKNSRINHLSKEDKISPWVDESNINGTIEHRKNSDSEVHNALELEKVKSSVLNGNESAASSRIEKRETLECPENDTPKDESREVKQIIESNPSSSLSLQKILPVQTDRDVDVTSFSTLSHGKQKKPPKKKSMKFYSPYDLNERDEDENTPLHVAIHARKIEHIKLLLESGASTARKCDGSYPVHTAISIGGIQKFSDFAYDCVTILVEYGADLSLKDDAFHTPLYLACEMNLPRIVSFILSDSEGISTLNARSDRFGGRPLHAAAKFDVNSKPGIAFQSTTVNESSAIHLDTNFVQTSRHGYPMSVGGDFSSESVTNSQCRITQLLLSQNGIEVDAQNMQGHTPLHVACSRGNWPIVRMLLNAKACPKIRDKRGLTPLQLARKRGMPVPNNLLEVLSDDVTSNTHQSRDLVVDPDNTTFLISHELCTLHRTCPPIRRDSGFDAPPENTRRLHVLVNENDGILRCGEFSRVKWQNSARRAALSDVLKCHEYEYIEKISELCLSIPDHPLAIAHLDADTAVSRWSFESALRAAGSVCEAVDKVVNGDHRNAFCAVRPPGHHAGPRGIVRCANDPEGGSHGFCLLNNVAIGAAYARNVYRHVGIKKIAIVDFDVHHGNGTEEIIRQLVPTVEKAKVRAPFAVGELSSHRYRPWLDETDISDVFFASTHGYGPRGMEYVGKLIIS
jgi:acetoin utilization deacetylase AcuC-like enzyme/ankyrin repeat protein